MDMWLQFAAREGAIVARSELEPVHAEATARFTPKLYDHRGRMHEFWTKFDGYILERIGIADPGGRVAEAIYRGFREEVRYEAFPETEAVLEALRAQGYALGVITNATEDVLDFVQSLGLAEYFDTITFSQEARSEKPDSAIFQLALRRMGCEPSEAVHVGDRYEPDVVGARRAGLAAVLLDREDRRPKVDCPVVRDLRGVPPLLDAGFG